jgi:electron transfer flavoprotein alpha subunit
MPATEAVRTGMRRFYALIPMPDGEGVVDSAPLVLARQLADRCGGEAHALVAGPAPSAVVDHAGEIGLDHAWTIPCRDGTLQPHQLADLYAAALRTPLLANGLDGALLLVAAGPGNEIFAGCLAARIDAMPLGRCDHFDFDASGVLQARRAAYGGRLATVWSCATGPAIAAVRDAGNLAPDMPGHRAGPIHEHTLDGIATARAPYAVSAMPRTEPHPSLDGARLVVAGGRGMGCEDAFATLYTVADTLHGSVGASLPAVDAGWAPVARQVGQSGKYVSPRIYLAVGISGTPQHLAGIDPRTRIVAVNRDREAPIFGVAQVGVVAEWQALLPELLAALDGARDGNLDHAADKAQRD